MNYNSLLNTLKKELDGLMKEEIAKNNSLLEENNKLKQDLNELQSNVDFTLDSNIRDFFIQGAIIFKDFLVSQVKGGYILTKGSNIERCFKEWEDKFKNVK